MFYVILGYFWNTLVVWGIVELWGVATVLNDMRLHTGIPVKKVVKPASSRLMPSHVPQLPPDANRDTQDALASLPLIVLLVMFSSVCQLLSPLQLSFPERHSPCSLGAEVRVQVGKQYGKIWRKVTQHPWCCAQDSEVRVGSHSRIEKSRWGGEVQRNTDI